METDSPLCIGIIAGGGAFPVMCAKEALKAGNKVVVIAHKDETDRAIERHSAVVEWVRLGQFGKVLKILRQYSCKKVLFAGTITKKRIFKDVIPDFKALSLWKCLCSRNDDALLRAISNEIEKEGIEVIPSTAFLQSLFAPKGVLTQKGPSEDELRDIGFGYRLQKKIGELDIGQTIVVKDRTVVAVEALEGTDECIRRASKLIGKGAVIVKLAKPNQDMRFDVPSVGVNTINTMIEAGARILAIEAKKTLLFDRDEAISLAERHGITIVGIDDDYCLNIR